MHLAGTERVAVTGCAFVRTDSNAVLLSGYNRNATVDDTEFAWLGMSAVALMGDTAEDDATGGTQPWGTVVSNSVFRELGIVEKQSSAVFLGRACLARVEANVMFNGPRAFINFNDGLGVRAPGSRASLDSPLPARCVALPCASS